MALLTGVTGVSRSEMEPSMPQSSERSDRRLSGFWLPSIGLWLGALVVLILVLLFRPNGILGKRGRDEL